MGRGIGKLPVGFDPWSIAISGAIMGVTTLIGHFKKRNAQKRASTEIVNEAAPLLEQNLLAWQQSSKTTQEQEQALANFDAIWAEVERLCSQKELGDAGRRCISERNRTATTNYNWFVLYRDPIANDPHVRPMTTAEQYLPSQLTDAQGNLVFDGNLAMIGVGVVIVSLILSRL